MAGRIKGQGSKWCLPSTRPGAVVSYERLTAQIRRAQQRIARLLTERYRAEAEGDAPRRARVEASLFRARTRRAGIVALRAAGGF